MSVMYNQLVSSADGAVWLGKGEGGVSRVGFRAFRLHRVCRQCVSWCDTGNYSAMFSCDCSPGRPRSTWQLGMGMWMWFSFSVALDPIQTFKTR